MKKSRLLSAVCACAIATSVNSANAAAVFYTNETAFNSATSGLSLSLEGFESPFDAATVVSFTELSIATYNTNNIPSDLESRVSEEFGGPSSTEGSRLAIYYTGTGGGGITITFDSPITAFSIDITDPLDGAAIDAFLSLSNSNGDSQTLLTGSQSNNSVFFAGITDAIIRSTA